MELAIQYLEDGPGVQSLAPAEARQRLQEAVGRLPLTYVLLGWNLPSPVLQVCVEETVRCGGRLYRWHPLLAGDGTLVPRREWRAIGLDGDPLPGFRGLDEYTFLCPNRPQVRQAVLKRLQESVRGGHYQGVFFDRIRYPSPARDPARLLGCFCRDCRQVAAQSGLDLQAVQCELDRLLATRSGTDELLQALLAPSRPACGAPGVQGLRAFMRFRAESITGMVAAAAEVVHDAGLEVGLDCFSPSLAWMVGQDLGALSHCGEWTKIMSYGHTLGPAGLPFELIDLARWLIRRGIAPEDACCRWLASLAGLSLSGDCQQLRETGLSSAALAGEILRARVEGVERLYAGIELVEIPGVAQLSSAQITADLRAVGTAAPDGVVLSWDLWHTPLERLDLVRSVLLEEQGVDSEEVCR